jgi:hypothetical protein
MTHQQQIAIATSGHGDMHDPSRAIEILPRNGAAAVTSGSPPAMPRAAALTRCRTLDSVSLHSPSGHFLIRICALGTK